MRKLLIDEEIVARHMPQNRKHALIDNQAAWGTVAMRLPESLFVPTSEPGIWLRITMQLVERGPGVDGIAAGVILENEHGTTGGASACVCGNPRSSV